MWRYSTKSFQQTDIDALQGSILKPSRWRSLSEILPYLTPMGVRRLLLLLARGFQCYMRILQQKLTEIPTSSACAPLNEETVERGWKARKSEEVVRRERGIRRRQVAWETTRERRGGELFGRRCEFAERTRATRRRQYKTISKEDDEQG